MDFDDAYWEMVRGHQVRIGSVIFFIVDNDLYEYDDGCVLSRISTLPANIFIKEKFKFILPEGLVVDLFETIPDIHRMFHKGSSFLIIVKDQDEMSMTIRSDLRERFRGYDFMFMNNSKSIDYESIKYDYPEEIKNGNV